MIKRFNLFWLVIWLKEAYICPENVRKMKIKLDGGLQTITVEEPARTSDIVKLCRKILPKRWGEFSIVMTKRITYFENPTIVDLSKRNRYPLKYPWLICTSLKRYVIRPHIYNIETK